MSDKDPLTASDCPPGFGYAKDIRKLFRDKDVTCMKPRGIDLSSYEDVKDRADDIYAMVKSGRMPKGGPAWTAETVKIFKCWIDQGSNP